MLIACNCSGGSPVKMTADGMSSTMNLPFAGFFASNRSCSNSTINRDEVRLQGKRVDKLCRICFSDCSQGPDHVDHRGAAL
jgi:hypothetical protein